MFESTTPHHRRRIPCGTSAAHCRGSSDHRHNRYLIRSRDEDCALSRSQISRRSWLAAIARCIASRRLTDSVPGTGEWPPFPPATASSSSDAAADPHRLSQASSAADGRRSDISARPGPDHKHASPSSPDEPLTTLAPHALSAPAVSSVRKVTRAGEDSQRRSGTGRRTSMQASGKLPTASTELDCHLASRNRWRWRASSVSACSTRRQAAGDATTRTTHSDRSCSLATASGCTNSIASTP